MPTGERGYSFITGGRGRSPGSSSHLSLTAWGGSGALLLLGGDEVQIPLKLL